MRRCTGNGRSLSRAAPGAPLVPPSCPAYPVSWFAVEAGLQGQPAHQRPYPWPGFARHLPQPASVLVPGCRATSTQIGLSGPFPLALAKQSAVKSQRPATDYSLSLKPRIPLPLPPVQFNKPPPNAGKTRPRRLRSLWWPACLPSPTRRTCLRQATPPGRANPAIWAPRFVTFSRLPSRVGEQSG